MVVQESMSVQENVQIVKDAYAAFGRGDIQGLLALFAEGIEWIAPGEDCRWLARIAGRRKWRVLSEGFRVGIFNPRFP